MTFTTPTGQRIHLDGRLTSCPDVRCKGSDDNLLHYNISPTHAKKGCRHCKRKFTYIRHDTVTGKRFSNARRQSKLRRQRKQAEFQDQQAKGVVL